MSVGPIVLCLVDKKAPKFFLYSHHDPQKLNFLFATGATGATGCFPGLHRKWAPVYDS